MPIRNSVQEFVKLGPLPASDASEEVIRKHEQRLSRIEEPITDEEAAELIRCFGSDDCYGLAWTLLHLIETAPGGVPLKGTPSGSDNEWIRRLWERAHR